MKKLGLIVNPIAGMGGRVGLKGSDGDDIVSRAIALGAVPSSPARAVEALRQLVAAKESFELMAAPGKMGEEEAREAGIPCTVTAPPARVPTTAEDTRRAAAMMLESKVDLLLFAGGDGTARDIHDSVDGKVIVLGIPAGVKVHSGVFAITPRDAGELAAGFVKGDRIAIREAEVMDIDEEAFRENRLSARLYGYLRIPYAETLVQNAKAGSPPSDDYSLAAIAVDVADDMEEDTVYIVGPGTTTRPIFDEMGLRKTLLGVDLVLNRQLVASDVNERQILEHIRGRKAKIVVSVIGGQGFIFGRGSQQISPEVIRAVGRKNIVVVATPNKLASLRGAPLLVDTGDQEVDRLLDGYMSVVTGYGRRVMYRVKSS